MADASHGAELIQQAVVFLGAAAIAVPVFRLIGLSPILGYLLAGFAIGPSGIGFFTDSAVLFSIAELGVVLFLFVIGLELRISHLMAMRRDIAWLGGLQLLPTAGVIMVSLMALLGMSWQGGLVVGLALALSATSIALQILQERGEMQAPIGRKVFAVLLFQDMSVVPILAIVPFLAAGGGMGGFGTSAFLEAGKAIAAIGAMVLIGRYGLNPMFRQLAKLGNREIMTIAALLVVLGSAWIMSQVGMSMALGAFLAGLLLAESNFRHELEADIEPFRGLLLGLFFMSVGMLIDAAYIRQNPGLVAACVTALILLKFLITSLIAYVEKVPLASILRGSALLTPAGEFSFVILPLAAGLGILTSAHQKLFMAVAAFSMLAGPLVVVAVEKWLASVKPAVSPEPEENFETADGKALVIGFGRFGQMVNQMLLSAGTDVTVIDNDVEQIEAAGRFGFKVYFGDGQRLDVLRAAGAERVELIGICVDNQQAATTITEILRQNFPGVKVLVRAFDRRHALELMRHEPHGVVREVFDSALEFGRLALSELGVPDAEAEAVQADVRRRDRERLRLQAEGDLASGSNLTHKTAVRERIQPQPLSDPKSKAKGLTPETQAVLDQARDRATETP
jgi:monovalent cation:proton antiporter-2 (CPA2) family protein